MTVVAEVDAGEVPAALDRFVRAVEVQGAGLDGVDTLQARAGRDVQRRDSQDAERREGGGETLQAAAPVAGAGAGALVDTAVSAFSRSAMLA